MKNYEAKEDTYISGTGISKTFYLDVDKLEPECDDSSKTTDKETETQKRN